ncbi:Salivary lysozyme-like [Frankliniella occidentalis]|nr:Salivary lysozyme-like [Frankliniella occidentalis]
MYGRTEAHHTSNMLPASRSAAWVGGIALLGLLALSTPLIHARVYEKCELAKDLKNKYGFPLGQIPTLVCIAFQEFNMSAVNRDRNKDKSIDYGIFQINNRYWCDRGPKKGCHVTCQTLLTDMDEVAKCVKAVYAETKKLRGDGFKAWSSYLNHLCDYPYPYTAKCDLN